MRASGQGRLGRGRAVTARRAAIIARSHTSPTLRGIRRGPSFPRESFQTRQERPFRQTPLETPGTERSRSLVCSVRTNANGDGERF